MFRQYMSTIHTVKFSLTSTGREIRPKAFNPLFGLSLFTKDLYILDDELDLINLQSQAGCPLLSQGPRNG